MSNLSTLKQQAKEMQAEIERLEAEEREPEIPVGTLCWFWDDNHDDKTVDIFERKLDEQASGAFIFRSSTSGWKHSRIANDIPGAMVWQKHDGGPCPVDGDTMVLQMFRDNEMNEGKASSILWQNVTAYAIINKAEWME